MKLAYAGLLGGALFLSACAGLLPIAEDVASIANTVIQDVMAGAPFEQVLKDTGTEDASLLVSIIGAILANPKSDPRTAAVYASHCAPYLAQAKVLLAAQTAAHPESL